MNKQELGAEHYDYRIGKPCRTCGREWGKPGEKYSVFSCCHPDTYKYELAIEADKAAAVRDFAEKVNYELQQMKGLAITMRDHQSMRSLGDAQGRVDRLLAETLESEEK